MLMPDCTSERSTIVVVFVRENGPYRSRNSNTDPHMVFSVLSTKKLSKTKPLGKIILSMTGRRTFLMARLNRIETQSPTTLADFASVGCHVFSTECSKKLLSGGAGDRGFLSCSSRETTRTISVVVYAMDTSLGIYLDRGVA